MQDEEQMDIQEEQNQMNIEQQEELNENILKRIEEMREMQEKMQIEKNFTKEKLEKRKMEIQREQSEKMKKFEENVYQIEKSVGVTLHTHIPSSKKRKRPELDNKLFFPDNVIINMYGHAYVELAEGITYNVSQVPKGLTVIKYSMAPAGLSAFLSQSNKKEWDEFIETNLDLFEDMIEIADEINNEDNFLEEEKEINSEILDYLSYLKKDLYYDGVIKELAKLYNKNIYVNEYETPEKIDKIKEKIKERIEKEEEINPYSDLFDDYFNFARVKPNLTHKNINNPQVNIYKNDNSIVGRPNQNKILNKTFVYFTSEDIYGIELYYYDNVSNQYKSLKLFTDNTEIYNHPLKIKKCSSFLYFSMNNLLHFLKKNGVKGVMIFDNTCSGFSLNDGDTRKNGAFVFNGLLFGTLNDEYILNHLKHHLHGGKNKTILKKNKTTRKKNKKQRKTKKMH
jgi:hypothetical protein